MAPKHVIFKSSFIMIVKYQWVLSGTFTLNFFRKISLFSIVLFTVWLNLAVPLKTVKLAYLKEPSLWWKKNTILRLWLGEVAAFEAYRIPTRTTDEHAFAVILLVKSRSVHLQRQVAAASLSAVFTSIEFRHNEFCNSRAAVQVLAPGFTNLSHGGLSYTFRLPWYRIQQGTCTLGHTRGNYSRGAKIKVGLL